jgi:hypothetical protein
MNIQLQLTNIKKSQGYNIRFNQLYIEFNEAFDCVGCFPKIEAKKKSCVPAMLISLTKITFTWTFNKVKLQNTLSGTFRKECDIRQGDFLSKLMFNIGPEKVMKNIENNPRGTFFNRSRQ